MNLRSRLATACLLAWCGQTAWAGECPDGYHKVGEQQEETATEIIVHPVCAPDETAAGIEARQQFCKAADLIRADQAGLRGLDFNADSEQFERFAKVSRDQKAAVEKKVFDALLDQALDASKEGAEAASKLNPWSVNKPIAQLKAAGFGNAKVAAALRRIALVQGKPAKAEAYKLFVDTVKGAKEGHDTDEDMAKEPDTAQLRFLLGALKIAQRNPELGLVVTTAEFAENFAYLGFLPGGIEAQARLTDEKLLNANRLAAQLRLHVAAKQHARADWQKAGNSGDPDCAASPPIAAAVPSARDFP